MRPRRLEAAGFTCFADPIDIDFTGMDVFAVTGPTGAGKSTIIDAICYALYGRIPRASDTQSLMSHNRDALRVQLEFDAAGERFRVARAINVTRKTKRDGTEGVSRTVSPIVLDQLIGGDWISLADRARDATGEIERIVGLDFDAFQRCVVLPQGKFQEFLAGDRPSRNKILKELLDIGIYERVMQAANAIAKDLGNEAKTAEGYLEKDFAGATEEALAGTRAELAAAAPQRDAAVARRDALTQALSSVSAFVAARQRGKERTAAREQALAEINDAEASAADGVKRVAALKKDIAGREKERVASPYDADRHHALSVARTRALATAKLEGELAQARAAAADESKVQAARDALARAAQRLIDADAACRDAVAAREASERADAAAHVRAGLKPGDPCPVCGGVVGKMPKAAASGAASAKKAEAAALAAQRKAAEEARAAQTSVERAEAAQRQEQDRAARVEAEIAAAAKELAALLPSGVAPGADAIAAALAEQESALSKRKAIEQALSGLRAQLAELEPKVNESGAMLSALQARAGQLANEAAAAKAEGDAELAKLKDLAEAHGWDDELALIRRAENPRDSFANKHRDATTEADELTRRITRLEGEATRIEQAIARAAELRAEATAKRERAQRYSELGLLLRSDAFQEFVISSAMAVLAETATSHLADMYSRFDMIVDDGEFKVVDHWQADQVRAARTLSGGETFVASLALALALSERLPELRSAAAARLESLFLDEGFGTLDPETLETVIGALESLRSEARMVGIVTHVPELAARIENRIVVSKSSSGSTIEVLRAGGVAPAEPVAPA